MNSLFEYTEAVEECKGSLEGDGDNKLFSEAERVLSTEINNEEKILKHPILHEAFDRIVEQHVPNQSTAFLSLCTATRPYNKSKKWKGFINKFGGKVDMIVVSNGGMMPQQFWKSWPYLNYDGGDHYDIQMYKDIMHARLLKFFRKHNYSNVIANFRPNLINHQPAHDALAILKEEGSIGDYIVMPNQELYDKAQSLGWKPPHGQGDMFPDLTDTILSALIAQVEEFGYDDDLLTIHEKIKYTS